MKKVYTLFLTLAVITGFAGHSSAQSNSGALPVILVGFNANLISNKKVALSWTTQQQINTDCFDLEKSSDGLNWKSIVSVKSSGNSAIPVTYNAVDNCPLKGSNFYRVKIKSVDGLAGYTIVKNVRMNAMGSINIYPNPSTGIINIALAEVPEAGYWNLSIINSMGQVLVQKRYSRNMASVSLSAVHYPNGNYTIHIADGNLSQSKKLMINHN
ncbi:MAG: T9SS type A sorting domain-containing protein [Chitinophagaceae bacterium]